MSHTPLAGSERQILSGAHATHKANPDERFEVTMILRRRAKNEFKRHVAAVAAGDTSRRLSRKSFGASFGAEDGDIAAVRTFAHRHELVVTHEAQARRTVMLSGTVAQFNEAFGTELEIFEHDNGTYRGRTGSIYLPHELHGIVEAVLGLDNRPQATPHFRVQASGGVATHKAASGAPTSYTPTQIAGFYGFPAGSGQGECIGIIELGGGYRPADLKAYFHTLGIAQPAVTIVSVDHGANSPTGSSSGPDAEVMLDIEVAGAIAPGARIAVYFAPNTDAGFLDAVTTAIHDSTNNPSVISISWGGPESSWTQQALTAFDEAFQAASTLGITVCVAAGDSGSTDGVTDGKSHVDFPASSPYALACGGTSLRAANTTISSEVVWNDGASGGATGGGISSVFPLPQWQTGLAATEGTTRVPLANRGMPDVSGDADPETGYSIRVDGKKIVVGGTSAVAPLWAALIARANGINGAPAGFLNPKIYGAPSALRDITQGSNGEFSASAGWDACTGLGSPNGAAIANLLKSANVTNTVQSVRESTSLADASERHHAKKS